MLINYYMWVGEICGRMRCALMQWHRRKTNKYSNPRGIADGKDHLRHWLRTENAEGNSDRQKRSYCRWQLAREGRSATNEKNEKIEGLAAWWDRRLSNQSTQVRGTPIHKAETTPFPKEFPCKISQNSPFLTISMIKHRENSVIPLFRFLMKCETHL